MQQSERGKELTKTSEGLRLKAYQDTGGVWTIGYGHTNGVRPNQVITKEVADQLFEADNDFAEHCVNKFALPCTQNQFDALVDFVFNVGPSQFLSSTLLKLHKAGEYDKAAAEFPKWKYDNGKVIRGLVVRRAAEKALYSLQEPEEARQRTDEPEHSASPVAYSEPASPSPSAVQSSPAQPAPASETARESDSALAALFARALGLLRKLAAGKAPQDKG
jgi:lysozyme